MMNLSQRKNLAALALRHCSYDGKKFADGVLEAAVCSSIWAKDKNELVLLMSKAMDKYEIPQGIKMPWGVIVTPSQTR